MTVQVFSPKWFFHDRLSEEDQQESEASIQKRGSIQSTYYN